MKKGRTMRERSGFVLIGVLLISLAIALLVFGATVTSVLDRQVATSQRTTTHAYYVAKAGLARMEAAVLRNLSERYAAGESGVCGVAVSDELDLGDIRLTMGGPPVVSPFGGYEHWLSYDVSSEGLIYLRSTGVVGPGTQTVQVVADIGPGPAGVYDNAIFATNVIPSSGAVRGTISVYGSMHIIDGELSVDDDAISFSGTAGLYNRYAGNPSNTQTSVSDESQNVFTSEALRTQDLCTRVKIKSGNLEIGKPNSGAGTRVGGPGTGEPNPNAIEGIYLGNGSVTAKGAAVDGSSPETLEDSYVYSRSAVGAYSDTYDLSMPELPAEYPPSNTLRIDDPDLCPWLSTSSGMLELPPPSSAGSVCSAIDPVSGATIAALTYVEGVLRVDPAVKELAFPKHSLAISSTVRYSGKASFLFGEGSRVYERDDLGRIKKDQFGNPIVKYDTLVRAADLDIRGSFVPADGDYLTGSGIALTTNGDATLNISSSGLTYGNDPVIASVVYAAGNVDVEKQLAVFGSLVAGSVTTTNVPSVAHNNLVSDFAEEFCLFGSLCRSGESGFNDGLLTKMTEENL